MIIDSWFDNYVGVVMLVRVVDGVLRKGERIRMMATNAVYPARATGCVHAQVASRATSCGRRGGLHHRRHQGTAGGQGGRHHHAGKEAAQQRRPATEALPGFKEIQPQVFAGLYPTEASEYDQLRDALEKLKLNDSSLRYEPEVSQALGFGFRCGFLGLLHMEIVQERLEREFDQDLITTAPSVVYEVVLNDGTVLQVENPSKMPDLGQDRGDPRAHRHGAPLHAAGLRRPGDDAVQPEARRADEHGLPRPQVHLTYELPLAEIVLDFFDKLKSVSRAATPVMDYEFKEYRAGRCGQGRHADQRRQGRCAGHDRAPGAEPVPRPRGGRQDARADPAPDVRRGDPGAIGANIIARETSRHCARTCWQNATAATSRASEAAREAEGRQEAHEADRLGRGAAGGLPGHPAGRRLNGICKPPMAPLR
jgi:hypothetical protein